MHNAMLLAQGMKLSPLHVQGKGGYGVGTSQDASASLIKAVRFAILGAINIPLYREHTVYFPTKTKFVKTKMSIFPRPADFGITASPIIHEACELLGIQNLTVKVCSHILLRSLHPMQMCVCMNQGTMS